MEHLSTFGLDRDPFGCDAQLAWYFEGAAFGDAWRTGGGRLWDGCAGACTEPVTAGSGDWPGWYEAIPRPPPDTPPEGTDAGWLPVGGGSDDVCTRPAGARC